MRSLALWIVGTLSVAAQPAAAAQNTSQLAENGWFSDDTRADGTGTQAAGTNLVSPSLTDDPEATATGTAAHDADIRSQIQFGPAPSMPPAGTFRGAVHISIAPGSGAGKSQISHRKDDGIGFAAGADAFGPATMARFSWLGDGTPAITASLKFGVKTADFGAASVSPRTGENAWDKLVIYEPGNLNGGVSDNTWRTEMPTFTTGTWWLVDRAYGGNTIGAPMTLSAMSSSPLVVNGTNTVADIYALITAPGAHVTSVQFGIGSGNPGGSVYVNELETNFYRPGSVTTFGSAALEYDQNVTNAAIFGSGNINGSFTTDRNQGVELGLRGKLRFNAMNSPENTFNSNADGTYTFEPGAPTGGPGWVAATTPFWNIEWSVNTDYDGSTSENLDQRTYELGMDFDPGPGTNYLVFDPITPNMVVPFWDHSIGDNMTADGAGVEATDATTYMNLLANNNLAQNSWSPEFFNDSPFDGFDPHDEGRYEFYLAAFDGGVEVARTQITIVVERPLEFDQNVTNEVIFGSGNDNGFFTVDRNDSVELGLRGKLRFPPTNIFNSNGDGTYTFDTGSGTGTPPNPEWSFEWSVNSDYDSMSGRDLDDLTYAIGMDFDPGGSTDYLIFDPITPNATIPYTPPSSMPFWDHAIGTNATPNGGGAVAVDMGTYLALLAANNLAQQSWRMTFFDEFPFTFDPDVPGRYEFYLAAFSGAEEVARTAITIFALDGASLTLEAEPCQMDVDPGKPGVQIEVELWGRNFGQNVTGFQAFLEYDDSLMSYEGSCSSYTNTPFDAHIAPITSAEVAPGELRLDGNALFLPPTDDDALLATLVFTVAAECVPVSVDFDLGQPFDSVLSFEGNEITTGLVDSPAIVPDDSAPIITPAPDITVAADANVGGGCSSAVVNYTPPAVVDTCTAVSLVCTPPSGSAFPAGQTTTVTCVATDACGNVSVDTFDVTVTNTNVVCLDVQLVGVTTATTRCIRFVADACSTATDISLNFDSSGLFSGEIELPCGSWTSLCVKDEQHTKWDTVALNLSGTKYVAAATVMLEGGDTDNDGDVDINDVTLFISQFGQLASAGGCPWNGITRDADFSNNGAVGAEDYSFLTANWLTTSGCACVALPLGGGPSALQTRLQATAQNAVVDLDGNGWIDWRDVQLFELRHGFDGSLSRAMRATTR